MVIQPDARTILDRIEKFMKLKESSAGDPDIYLGAKVKKVQMNNDVWCWSITPLSMSRRLCEIVKSI